MFPSKILHLRGKHGNHSRVDDNIKDSLRNFIKAIPKIEIHYCRADTQKEYIDGSKTIAEIYRDYVKHCEEKREKSANYIMFNRIFNGEFNIAFYQPKKDQCEDCVTYNNANGEDKNRLKSKYENHLKEKELSRMEKVKDKKEAEDKESTIVAVYDLQAVMPCPWGRFNLSVLTTGMNLGWSSPMIVKLRNATETPLYRPITEEEGSWIVSVGFLCSVFTNFPLGMLLDCIGRKYCLILTCVPKIIVSILFIFATDVWMLVLGRAFIGIGDIFLLSVVSVYASEIASKDMRGILCTFQHVFSSLGIVISLSVGPFTSYTTFSIVFAAIISITSIPLLFLPDSPYFLYSKGMGSILWVLIAELFEGPARAVGVTTSLIITAFFIFLTTKYFAALTLDIGPATTYWLFSSACAILCLFIYYCVPETKGKSFSEIQEALGDKEASNNMKESFVPVERKVIKSKNRVLR